MQLGIEFRALENFSVRVTGWINEDPSNFDCSELSSKGPASRGSRRRSDAPPGGGNMKNVLGVLFALFGVFAAPQVSAQAGALTPAQQQLREIYKEQAS
jgi:hypothetical protein